MSDAHLHSAARAFAEVMAEMHPEYVWTPVVRPEGVEAQADLRGATLRAHPSPVGDDADALVDGDGSASPADAAHDDALHEAA